MSKTQRLIELMMTVNTRKKFTARELAEEFGVSYRTILRDLDELSALGVPLYSEVGSSGGFYLLRDRMLPPIEFKESEAISMFFAYQSLQFFGSLPFQTETRSALKKFYQYLPEDVKKRIDAMKDRIVFWHPKRPQPAAHLAVMLDAAVEQYPVLIFYDGRKGTEERTILPIGLYSYNGFWYCPAYCFKRSALRLFRADRIQNAQRTKVDNIPDLPFQSVMDWILLSEEECKDPVDFVGILTRDGVRRAMSDLDLGRIVYVQEDGTGLINTRIPRTEITYFADLIWNLGTEAMLKEPPEMIDYLKQRLIQLSNRYNCTR